MAKLSDKYIAGFLDSDGSVQIMYRYPTRDKSDSTQMRVYVGIEFTQLSKRDEVLHKIQEAIGGKLYFSEERAATTLKLFGKPAVMCLSRIRKHLVIKRHYANIALDMAGKIVNRKEATKQLKAERRRKSLPLPNYPSRKWMAGYIDGDGCFGVRVPKGRSSAQITLEATSSDYDSEGIELIQKAFGGSISIGGKRRNLRSLTITMPPSKAKQILSHCGKYLTIKKTQADFILGCARMGHYRDGKSIQATVKQLKSQPHRLNEPKPGVSQLLENVDGSIETRAEKGLKSFLGNGGCIQCGNKSHYSDGVCRKCYDSNRRKVMRQSELAEAS